MSEELDRAEALLHKFEGETTAVECAECGQEHPFRDCRLFSTPLPCVYVFLCELCWEEMCGRQLRQGLAPMVPKAMAVLREACGNATLSEQERTNAASRLAAVTLHKRRAEPGRG